MSLNVLSLSLLLFLAVGSYANELTGREYWNSVLPKTPMPNSISELLDSDMKTTSTSNDVDIGVGPGGVSVGVGPGKQHPGHSGGVSVGVGAGPRKQNPGKQGGVGVRVDVGPGKQNPGKGRGVSVGVGVGVGHGKGKRYRSPFDYKYAASETQLRDDPNTALFFLEKDLHPSTKMTLDFTETTTNSPFIPRAEADNLPFSSSKFSEILDHFEISEDSSQAEAMKQTITNCEIPPIKGEKKYCATSLESMVDFATSSLGTRDVHAASTCVYSPNTPKQEYTVIQSKILSSDELVACHMETYAYAIFYCHLAKKTQAYKVNLVGKNSNRVDAIAVCHMDTSSWNPKHLAFQMLKVEPGSVPVCHFLPQDHVMWTRSA